MRSHSFFLVFLVMVFFRCMASTGVAIDDKNGSLLQHHNRDVTATNEPLTGSGKRGARFLGLLGLLTGLTLVDSLDDDSDRPRRSGYVKIDVGRPSSLDAFYGAFGYNGAPYWTGGSSINIKIPFRPGGGLSPGGDYDAMALFPFPVPYPSGPLHFGSVLPHGGSSSIEPRPSIFADPIPSGSNGSETVLADDGEALTRKTKTGSRKSVSVHRSHTKVSPPRTIRSTLRADDDEELEGDDEPAAVESLDTTDSTVYQDQPTDAETVSSAPSASIANTTAHPTADSLHAAVSEVPEPIVQDINYVTQPALPSSYHSHQHSLADVSVIDLTTSHTDPTVGEEFQPSRADHWQDFYSSAADDHRHRQRGFLPITIPAY